MAEDTPALNSAPIVEPALAPKANHVRADRSETIVLDWPIEFEGTIYETVTVKRLSTADIKEYHASIKAAEEAGRGSEPIRFPMYDVPNQVLDILDADDEDRINEVTARFLPRRYRAEPE